MATNKKTRMITNGIYASFISLLIVLFSVSTASATIAVDPSVIEVSVERGSPYEGVYKVLNVGEEPVQVTVEPEDWLVRHLERDAEGSVDEWLSFAEREFEIEPGELKEIPYTVTLPYAMMGERVAQVFFAFHPLSQDETVLRTRLGVIFYAAARGTEDVRMTVDELRVVPSRNDDGTYNMIAKCLIANHGNVHVRPAGVVVIRKNGEEVAKITIEKRKGIYDHATDSIEGYLKHVALTPGTYVAEARINCSMYEKELVAQATTNFTI